MECAAQGSPAPSWQSGGGRWHSFRNRNWQLAGEDEEGSDNTHNSHGFRPSLTRTGGPSNTAEKPPDPSKHAAPPGGEQGTTTEWGAGGRTAESTWPVGRCFKMWLWRGPESEVASRRERFCALIRRVLGAAEDEKDFVGRAIRFSRGAPFEACAKASIRWLAGDGAVSASHQLAWVARAREG